MDKYGSRKLIRREDGKVIGEVIEDVFVKHISGKKHFLRTPAGIACDYDVIFKAEKLGAKICEVVDDDTGKEYYATINTFRDKYIPIDRGYGKQWVLLFKYWKNSKEMAKDPPEKSNQLELF